MHWKVGTRSTARRFYPAIEDLQTLVKGTLELYKGFHDMFDQVPRSYDEDPTGGPQVRRDILL